MSSPLSSFLRASASGQKPVPPPEVRETQRKYGFGGKIPRAVVLSLLAAFAVGVAIQPNKPAPARAAQVQSAAPASVDRILGVVEDFRPVHLPGDTVINSLLLERKLKSDSPCKFTKQVDVVDPQSGKERRVVLFQAGDEMFVNDVKHGTFPLPAVLSDRSPDGLVAAARKAAQAGYARETPSRTSGHKMAHVIEGEAAEHLYMALGSHFPGAVVDSNGLRVLALYQGGKIHVASDKVNAASFAAPGAPTPDDLKQAVITACGGAKGYTVLTPGGAGAFSQDCRVDAESIKIHRMEAPKIAEVVKSPSLVADIAP